MAASDCIPTCKCGKPLRAFVSSGKIAKRCSDCGGAGRKAKQKPLRVCWLRKCWDCGARIAARSTFCKPCYEARKPKRDAHECKGCGKAFKRHKHSHDSMQYCSRACAFTHIKQWRTEARPKPAPFSRVYFNACKQCGKEWTARHKASVCSRECTLAYGRERGRTIIAARVCKQCSQDYYPRFTGGMLGRFCSDACKKLAQKEHGRVARRKSRKAYGGAGYRARARKAGVAYEPINRIKVFESAGWRCQICGKSTPRERQGHRYSNSPELDHVVPFALKGPHLYSNVQCLCRECNAMKGGHTVIGQRSLFNQ